MSYTPVGQLPIINPVVGSEKEGDLKIETVNGLKTVFIWLGEWKQLYPAVFA
jgi:hypothetical protein